MTDAESGFGVAPTVGRCRRVLSAVLAVMAMMLSTPFASWASAAAAATLPAPSCANGCEGSQGTDVALPPTSSAVTISLVNLLPKNSNLYSDYKNTRITVNQTANLVNQTVSVTWSGAPPTLGGQVGAGFNGLFAGDFLQIMQCWSSPTASGPTPQQCEFGGRSSKTALSAVPGQNAASNVDTRFLDNTEYESNLPPGDVLSPGLQPSVPFTAVDGTTIGYEEDTTKTLNGGIAYPWTNPYWDPGQSNDDDFGLTSAAGNGSEALTLDTAVESNGLGCGKATEPLPGGSTTTPKCWLVIVPRGSPLQEDTSDQLTLSPGDPLGQRIGVLNSPLGPPAWANHVAIPLSFNPISTACAGNNAVRIVGNEMANPAATSWDPKLCAQAGAAPYTYTPLPDDQDRTQLAQGTLGTTTAPAMAVVSAPLKPDSVSSSTPIVYAPLTLSGVVVGFNIQRSEGTTLSSDTAENALVGTGVQHIYLTPRLVAKMLTESYGLAFPKRGIARSGIAASYKWVLNNPPDLLSDPDFKQYNPEFNLNVLSDQEENTINMIVEEPSSDAAAEVWSWILSDPAAKAWLSGTPDPWGMTVNPYYNLNAKSNPTGEGFGSPVPNSYPASDPYTYQENVVGYTAQPPPLHILDVSPYASSMQAAALEARNGTNGGKWSANPGALSPPANPEAYWSAAPAQPPGQRIVLTITDAASAVQYGLQTASLSVAGDDGAKPQFIAPDVTSFDAAEAKMVPDAAGLLTPNVASAGVYPLTALAYSASLPTTLSTSSRKALASYVNYAATTGQTPGTTYGTLPAGYAPLPKKLQAQAVTAAALILTVKAPSTSSSTTTTQSSPSTLPFTVTPNAPVDEGGSDSFFPEGGSSATPSTGTTSTTTRSKPSTLSPATATSTTRGGPRRVALAESTTPTQGVLAGAVRYVAPIVLGIGLAAALAARWLSVWRKRTKKVAGS